MNYLDNNGPSAFPPELLETILGYDKRDQPEGAYVCQHWYLVSLHLSTRAASAKILNIAHFFLKQVKQPAPDISAKVEQIKQDAASLSPNNFNEIKLHTCTLIERFIDIAKVFPSGSQQTHLLRQVIRPLAELGNIASALNIAHLPGNAVSHLQFTQDVLDVLLEQGKIEKAQKIATDQSDPLLKDSLLAHCIRNLTNRGLFAVAETVLDSIPIGSPFKEQSAQIWIQALRYTIFQLIKSNKVEQAIQLACSIANRLKQESVLDSMMSQLIRQDRLDEALTVIDLMSPADKKERLEMVAELFAERGEHGKAQLALSKIPDGSVV